MTFRSKDIKVQIKVGGKTKWVEFYRLFAHFSKQDYKSDDNFEKFWDQYPRKEAKAKAEKIFKRLTKKEKDIIFQSLPKHLQNWKTKDRSFIPMPTTWLNQKRFNDEVVIEVTEEDKVKKNDMIIRRKQIEQREYFNKAKEESASIEEIADILGKYKREKK
tara:strand:+ start:404 stop:886 length:483 start_codon:yes stop_codon:yes gene_type:complete